MSLEPDLFDPPPADPDDAIALADYAERAYLEYALSVVKGRALPDVCDGQKPVQRRILYSMQRMGLGFGAGGAPKPVKSARVVGDVLGRFHPHSDQAAYDALVRMAQGFSQRYPLIDGQGNFGSRDGDGAAAMRYTEARLAPIARLLLDEIDEGTVDFVPNYDGSTQEPSLLPARLPFALLNGASGIAVGLATEIPSHNLREVAAAAVALVRNDKLSDEDLFELLPAPDFPGGAQIISSAADIREAYRTGRGSLKLRARWKIEDLARGQWQLVVTELPPGTSAQKVLEEIEELTNPKLKAGKKALSQEQVQLKAAVLAVLDTVRDESNKDAPVRLVFEPRSRTVEQGDLITTLLAHTSLEGSVPLNLTMVGRDGRPTQKSLRQMLAEWIDFRQATVQRRTQHRLARVLERIHVLEGRQIVLLNIDEVIRIIRNADEPKPALIERFKLSDRQAEDILEIRLRQLARLEAIKIEQELKGLREDQGRLEEILGSPAALKRTLIKEIEADAKAHGDDRRTLVQEERRAVAEIKVVDEPVTVVVSLKGWVRALKGHEVDPATLAFKAGDALYGTFACRSVDPLLVFGSAAGGSARVYSVAVAALPGGRGDGQPITSLIDLESRHPAGALLRRGARDDAAAGQHRRLRPAGQGGRHGGAQPRRQELPERGRCAAGAAAGGGGGRPHPGGLPEPGCAAAGLPARRAEAPAQRRPRTDADGRRCQGPAAVGGQLRRRAQADRPGPQQQGQGRTAARRGAGRTPGQARPQGTQGGRLRQAAARGRRMSAAQRQHLTRPRGGCRFTSPGPHA